MYNKYGPILIVVQEAIVGNVKHVIVTINMVLLQGFIGYKQGAVAPKRTWGPFIFISKFKFL